MYILRLNDLPTLRIKIKSLTSVLLQEIRFSPNYFKFDFHVEAILDDFDKMDPKQLSIITNIIKTIPYIADKLLKNGEIIKRVK